MSMAVLSCEFLISPATCDASDVEAQVISLVEAAKCLDEGIDPPLLEPDALGRLIAAGAYPATGLFKTNLSNCQIDTYSSKDVARIVSSIISRAQNLLDFTEPREIEWNNKVVAPPLINTWPNRADELEELFTQIVVQGELDGKQACVIHRCDGNPGPQFLVSGELSDAYPSPQIPLPHFISKTVQTHPTFKDYLRTLNYHEIFERSTDDFNFKLSFYIGALSKAKLQGLSSSHISLESFQLGPAFSNSMWRNQCGPGGTFAGVLLDTISDLLVGNPKNPISVFRKSATSAEARVYGTFTAYRTHVTKGGSALRLMFWRDDQGIVLANVGPKHELVIEKP